MLAGPVESAAALSQWLSCRLGVSIDVLFVELVIVRFRHVRTLVSSGHGREEGQVRCIEI
jgi:hypothetical protein